MAEERDTVTEYGRCAEVVAYPDGGRVYFYSDSLPVNMEEVTNRNLAVARAFCALIQDLDSGNTV